MGRYLNTFFVALIITLIAACNSSEFNAPSNTVNALLDRMSLEQKVGQMTQLNIEVLLQRDNGIVLRPVRIDTNLLIDAVQQIGVGSIMNTATGALSVEEWNYITATIRQFSSLDNGFIPVIYGIDAVHGANYAAGSTLFPHQLAMAATWNDSLIQRVGSISAMETRKTGVHWVFSPILDVARQPLWVQFFQTFGEDTYLASNMGESLIKGYQEADFPVAACAKHFVGYGFPFSGKDRTPVHIGERALREIHLPTFQKAIDAGLKTIMVGSNDIDGIPMLASNYWLTQVLRNEMGFRGVLLSDWADVNHLVDWHHVAENALEATFLAVSAGLDMAMVPNDYSFHQNVLELIKTGRISEERIDASVRRILQLKMDMGLLVEKEKPSEVDFDPEKHAQAALETALQGITLLKNDGPLLPLAPGTKVFITGPGADDARMYAGAWSRTWQGMDSLDQDESKATLRCVFTQHWPEDNVGYANVCAVDSITDIEIALKAAGAFDVVIAVMGTLPSTEKPGDITDLSLPEAQISYVQAFKRIGKKVVLVLLEDRPRIVAAVESFADVIVMAYRPGLEGAKALSQLLVGERNFSGKLPFTYPSAVNDFVAYDHASSETIGVDWGPSGFKPQWEFGHGLSFTTFSYEQIALNRNVYGVSDTLFLTFVVKNTGQRDGQEVVQVFISDEVASTTPPVKKLRAYQKLDLQTGERKVVQLAIPIKELAFVGSEQYSRQVEAGWFTAQVGELKARFEVK